MRRSQPFWTAILLIALLPTMGCMFRTRPVEETYSKAPLQESTQAALIESINRQAQKIQSLQATVDIDTSVGGAKKGQVTDYKEIRGYVLARKPAMLHMIGLLPIVRTTAFDMVSDGQEFKLWIPPKNRFVVGRNDVQSLNSDQPMENIRPSDIYDALLIHPIDPEHDIAVLENGYEILHDPKGHRVLQEDYELVVIQKRPTGWGLSRKIVFSRTQTDISGRNLEVENCDLAAVVQALKKEPGKDIIVYGGANFVSSLISQNLIDEYFIFRNPVAIGNGLSIFKEKKILKLESSIAYNNGKVWNKYLPV